MEGTNRQLVLRERPTGDVTEEHFELVESDVPEPGHGEVLLRTMWLSFDPAQRGWLTLREADRRKSAAIVLDRL